MRYHKQEVDFLTINDLWLLPGIGFLLLNLITFCVCGWDKHCARRNLWRVPEATLLGLSLLGGCFGMWIGMRTFRHKTRHRRFTVLVPLACLLWAVIVGFVLYSWL